MRLTRFFLLGAVALPALGTNLAAQSRAYTAPMSASASTSGAKVIRVEAKAGSLTIEGRAGLTEARVKGTAYASARNILDKIKLTAERHGDAVEIFVDIPDHGWSRDDRDDNWEAGLDLTIEVPNTIALDVLDGSGDIEIKGVGALALRDGSGDMHIEHVGGDVHITDGSGGIFIRDVHGNVDVPSDGSGELEVRHVTGYVHVGAKGSGQVSVDDVGGDFTVDHKSSGDISYANVKGRVEIPERRRGRHSRDR